MILPSLCNVLEFDNQSHSMCVLEETKEAALMHLAKVFNLREYPIASEDNVFIYTIDISSNRNYTKAY